MTDKFFDQRQRYIAARNGLQVSIDILIEEMSELTKALLKHRRNPTFLTRRDILEERADVSICLDHIDQLLNFSDDEILFLRSVKLNREILRDAQKNCQFDGKKTAKYDFFSTKGIKNAGN